MHIVRQNILVIMNEYGYFYYILIFTRYTNSFRCRFPTAKIAYMGPNSVSKENLEGQLNEWHQKSCKINEITGAVIFFSYFQDY
jgi:hypothetical protein